MSGLRIRPATRDDVGLVLQFIRELAEYEKLAQYVTATEADIDEAMFGDDPSCRVLIAEFDGSAAGFALFFRNFSTFVGRPGFYLEDLFVRPDFRGHGIGKALLASLAALAEKESIRRIDWAVLDWNEPAIGFYERLGARPLSDWRIFRLTGDPLTRLGDSAPQD